MSNALLNIPDQVYGQEQFSEEALSAATETHDATENVSVAPALPTPNNPGFALVSPSAVKRCGVLLTSANGSQKAAPRAA